MNNRYNNFEVATDFIGQEIAIEIVKITGSLDQDTIFSWIEEAVDCSGYEKLFQGLFLHDAIKTLSFINRDIMSRAYDMTLVDEEDNDMTLVNKLEYLYRCCLIFSVYYNVKLRLSAYQKLEELG